MPLPGQTLGEADVVSVDPAAGGDIVFTADSDLLVHSLTFSFSTSATVVTRQVELRVDDGTAAVNVFLRSTCGVTQAQSVAGALYYGFAGQIQAGSPGSGRGAIAMPPGGIRMRKGDRLVITAVNKDVGDDFSAAILQIERLGAS
jgi:hypothetical protein